MGAARLWLAVLRSGVFTGFQFSTSSIWSKFSFIECNLFSFLLWMGGIGVMNQVTTASHCYASSIRSTTSLVKLMVFHYLN